MSRGVDTSEPGSVEVAKVLAAIADLMESVHEDDLMLQTALSKIAPHVRSNSEMIDLQHVDLLTQLHKDIAAALRALADVEINTQIPKGTLRSKLTLRSFQDALLDGGATTKPQDSGELSLF
ncbi:MAG: hypothetical protein QNJ20_18390 [Paracoccaceae bacterium]|nr:hypothetical protein [Paracoccaceae bacterium]